MAFSTLWHLEESFQVTSLQSDLGGLLGMAHYLETYYNSLPNPWAGFCSDHSHRITTDGVCLFNFACIYI